MLAWTFNSHLGGEEQALVGLLLDDDRPSWKVDEFARIAREFRQLKTMGFPRYERLRVAVHDPFDTMWLTSPPPGPNSVPDYFNTSYTDQVTAAQAPLFRDNVDAAAIDIGHDSIYGYKLVVLSGGPSAAKTLARFENTPDKSPAITVNRFGKGHAISLAPAAQPGVIASLIRSLYASLAIRTGPKTPDGVVARIVAGRTLYVNTTASEAAVVLPRAGRDMLTGKAVAGTLRLDGYGVALVD